MKVQNTKLKDSTRENVVTKKLKVMIMKKENENDDKNLF